MKYLCMVLGFLTGKWNVKCADCGNLDSEGKCFGHKMPDEVIKKDIMCGFWKKP